MNIDKALRAKLKSCTAVKTEYEVTGGGITGVMDTARFELFRSASSAFYKELPPGEGKCAIDISEDKKGKAVVQQTYKVRRQDSDGQIVGYTLNLYTTTSKILINGKEIDRFINIHLPRIHEIMCRAITEWKADNTDHLNAILAQELQHILDLRQSQNSNVGDINPNNKLQIKSTDELITNRSVSSGPDDDSLCLQLLDDSASPERKDKPLSANSSPTPKRNLGTPPPADNRCSKCNKNCITRAVLCEMGNHWIHYRCDKLSNPEIEKMASDINSIYNCKNCMATSDHTLLKLPHRSHPTEGTKPNSKSKKNPKSQKSVTMEQSCNIAQDILNEENSATCPVCSQDLLDDEATCSKCYAVCHSQCMNTHDPDICLSCTATNQQMNITPHTQVHTDIDSDTQTKHIMTENARSVNNTDIHHCGQTKTDTNNSSNKNAEAKQQRNSSDSNTIKLRELRQLEQRLRKWEDELKFREAKSKDITNECRRLEEYLAMTEARNIELDKTIRTLQRKINLLETNKENKHTDSDNKSQSPHRVEQCSTTDELIGGVRDQVTRYVLRKVAQQIDSMENIELAQNANNSVTNPVNIHDPGHNITGRTYPESHMTSNGPRTYTNISHTTNHSSDQVPHVPCPPVTVRQPMNIPSEKPALTTQNNINQHFDPPVTGQFEYNTPIINNYTNNSSQHAYAEQRQTGDKQTQPQVLFPAASNRVDYIQGQPRATDNAQALYVGHPLYYTVNQHEFEFSNTQPQQHFLRRAPPYRPMR
ncbi:MAG: hypothetical protein ABW185_18045 [Sedimenticola sp.]